VRVPGPNQTERAYGGILAGLKEQGTIIAYQYEIETLYLAPDCRYTPDYKVLAADGVIEYHEVKGRQIWEDSKIKFKWARTAFPHCRFVWAKWDGKKWNIKRHEEVERMSKQQYPDYRHVKVDPDTLVVTYLSQTIGKVTDTGRKFNEGKDRIYEHELSDEVFYSLDFAAFDLVAQHMRGKRKKVVDLK
jgi:hypothetical protein